VVSAWARVARLLQKTMSPGGIDIPENPEDVRAFLAAMQARLVASEQALEAKRTAHQTTREQIDAGKNAARLARLQIEKLKVQLARLRRMKFGQSSERLTLLADQLELTLEDLEAEHAHAGCVVAGDTLADVPQALGRKPRREPLPAHLPRQEVIHLAPERRTAAPPAAAPCRRWART